MNLLLLRGEERHLPAADPRARHITSILRLGPGDTLRAGIIGGTVGTATITSITDGSVALEYHAEDESESLSDIRMLLGHPRPLVLKRLLRDLTTIGVGAIHVVHSDLGERSYFDSSAWDDVKGALLEGASIGGTTTIPEVRRFGSLDEAVSELDSGTAVRLVPHIHTDDERADRRPLTRVLRDLGPARAVAAVGSERGWSARELSMLVNAGFLGVTLGPRILRTENAAAIVAWTLVDWHRGGAR